MKILPSSFSRQILVLRPFCRTSAVDCGVVVLVVVVLVVVVMAEAEAAMVAVAGVMAADAAVTFSVAVAAAAAAAAAAATAVALVVALRWALHTCGGAKCGLAVGVLFFSHALLGRDPR